MSNSKHGFRTMVILNLPIVISIMKDDNDHSSLLELD